MTDERAERAILDRAEAYRLVTECKDMRQLAEDRAARISRLLEVVALLNSMILSGESHSQQSMARVRAALDEESQTKINCPALVTVDAPGGSDG